MKLRTTLLCAAGVVAALSGHPFPQEAGQAQAPAGAPAAREFNAAAPDLFRAWLVGRPDYLRKLSLAQPAYATVGKGGTSQMAQYFTFMQCRDATPPSVYRVDVKQSDPGPAVSEGHLLVPVKMTCIQNGAFSSALNADKAINQAAACLGSTYDECLAAGLRPTNRMMKSMWKIKGIGTEFNYEGEQHIVYQWAEGKWAIQSQREEPPLRSE